MNKYSDLYSKNKKQSKVILYSTYLSTSAIGANPKCKARLQGQKLQTKLMKNFEQSHAKVISKETQKKHPFGFAAKRFWRKIIPCPEEEDRSSIKVFNEKYKCTHIRQSSILKKRNNMEEKINKNIKKYNSENSSNAFDKTRRVLFTDKDYEKPKITRKKFYEDKNKIKTLNKSMYESLIEKTPLFNEIKGKKRMNLSVDWGNKPDNDYFSESFLMDKTYNRIYGISRKHLIKDCNIETKPIDPLLYGKKHFPQKFNKTVLNKPTL